MKTCATSRRFARHHGDEDDHLLQIARLVDAGFDDVDLADQNAPRMIFGAVIDEVGVDLHVKPIDCHPSVELREFRAPDEWDSIGLVTNAWASSYDKGAIPKKMTDRNRHRIRMLHLVARSGESIAIMTNASTSHITRQPSTPVQDAGQLDEFLRRSLGLPTAPPPANSLEFWASWWIDRVFREAATGALRGASWSTLARMHPLHDQIANSTDSHKGTMADWAVEHLVRAGEIEAEACPWSMIHEQAIAGVSPILGLPESFAAWMDVGMFARAVLSAFAPIDDLLLDLNALLESDAYGHLIEAIEAWGLLLE